METKIHLAAYVPVAVLCAATICSNPAVADYGTQDGYPANLVFDLRIKGDIAADDPSTYENVCDAMTWSASEPLTASAMSSYNPDADANGYAAFGTPDPIAVSNLTIIPPGYPYVEKDTTAIHFPNTMRSHDNGDGTETTNCFPQAIQFSRAVPTGSNVTYHVRFRWDGNLRQAYEQTVFQNGMDANGGFAFRMYHTGLTDDITHCNIRYYVMGATVNHYVDVAAGKWNDFVVRMVASDDCDGLGDAGTAITVFRTEPWKDKDGTQKRLISKSSFAIPGKFCATAPDAAGLSLGHKDGPKYTKYQGMNGESGNAFVGMIWKLSIYDRALTDREMLAALLSSDGSGVSSGSENGSSDEFADADGAADVYAPMSMPMTRMLKALTADAPSLTVSFPMREEEEGLVRMLRLATLPADVGESAPVAISVNGAAVGTYDFAAKPVQEIPIPARFMKRNEDGFVTLTISRTGNVAGSLGIDAFRLGGSWAFGKQNLANDPDCFIGGDKMSHIANEYDQYSWALPGGPWGIPYVKDQIYGMKNESESIKHLPVATFCFDVPEFAAKRCASRWEFGIQNYPATNATLDLYLNGLRVRSGITNLARGDVIGFDIEPNTLSAGLNCVTVSNCSYNFNASYQYASVALDFVRYKISMPKHGTVVIIR